MTLDEPARPRRRIRGTSIATSLAATVTVTGAAFFLAPSGWRRPLTHVAVLAITVPLGLLIVGLGAAAVIMGLREPLRSPR